MQITNTNSYTIPSDKQIAIDITCAMIASNQVKLTGSSSDDQAKQALAVYLAVLEETRRISEELRKASR